MCCDQSKYTQNNTSVIKKINEIASFVEGLNLKTHEELEDFKSKYKSKSGVLNSLFNDFKSIPNNEKKDVGKALNDLKNTINKISQLQKSILSENKKYKAKRIKKDKEDK